MSSRPALDPVVHQPVRLGILGMLEPADRLEFRLIRDSLDVSDSNLSQHLTVLENAGLVEVTKGSMGRRPRTWIRMTPGGRSALATYLRSLRRLVGEPLLSTAEPAAGQRLARPRLRPQEG